MKFELVTRLIEKTATGGTVLDPFCGSGTVAIAAFRTGRKFIGAELDANYCDIATRRLNETDLPLLSQEGLNFEALA